MDGVKSLGSVEQSRYRLYHKDPLIEVHHLDDVLDDRHEHFFETIAHDPNVVGAGLEYLLDRSYAASAGGMHLAPDNLKVVEFTNAGRWKVVYSDHYGRALERVRRSRAIETFEHNSRRAAIYSPGIEQPILLGLAVRLDKNVRYIGKSVRIGVVRPHPQSAT
jgi:hypothetical protein